MSELTGFSIRNLSFHQGAKHVPEGPTACFEIIPKGTPPSAQTLRGFLPLAPELWRELPFVVERNAWFSSLCQHGEPSRLGDWIAALLTLFQRLSMDAVGPARVLSEREGVLTLAAQYSRQPVLQRSLEFALRQVLHWLRPGPAAAPGGKLAEDLARWMPLARTGGLMPYSLTAALIARRRGIPCATPGQSFVALGWGVRLRRIEGTFSHETGTVVTRMVKNKFIASMRLAASGLPVTKGRVAFDEKEALAAATHFGWPVVVKPVDQDQGIGVVTGLSTEAALLEAFAAARKLSPDGVLVERQEAGADHRLLVVRGRCLIVTRRTPATVVGDGRRTVAELLAELNSDPRRGSSPDSLMLRVALDAEARALLKEQGLEEQSVPAEGRRVPLRRIANISRGGTAEDVTAGVHPDNRRLAERAGLVTGLDVAGVDFLCPDISRSWREVGGVICEVNAQPGLRVHWLGDPARDLDAEIFDALHGGHEFRVPVAAVTGTNGKTTTCRMLQRIFMAAGRRTGLSCSMGVWVDDEILSTENFSGEPGARMVLNNPDVEAAVVEMPRQGLIRFGHACDRYDVAALLNVQNDHIGTMGINTKAEMARLKAEVLLRAGRAVVVNADDPECLAVSESGMPAPRLLFAYEGTNPALAGHLAAGGVAVYSEVQDGRRLLVVDEGAARGRRVLMSLSEIPAVMDGLLHYNELNAIAACAVAWGLGLPAEAIRSGLSSFANTVECNPGRYNFIEGFPARVLLDFAHNPEGVAELMRVAAQVPVSGKKWFVSTKIGNRHRSTLEGSIPHIAGRFDRYIAGCEPGRSIHFTEYGGENPMWTMLNEFRSGLERHGVPPAAILVEPEPEVAIRLALCSAEPGDLVVIGGEPWPTLELLGRLASERAAWLTLRSTASGRGGPPESGTRPAAMPPA